MHLKATNHTADTRISTTRHGLPRTGMYVFGALFLGLIYSPPAYSHGKETHPTPDDKHLAAMRSVKEKIPQELQQIDRVPVDASESNLAAGHALFGEHCVVCHGEGGAGDGPAAKGMDPRPANFLDRKHSAMYGPGEKFWIITHGATETGMPAYGARLSEQERWSLVLHILSFQQSVEE